MMQLKSDLSVGISLLAKGMDDGALNVVRELNLQSVQWHMARKRRLRAEALRYGRGTVTPLEKMLTYLGPVEFVFHSVLKNTGEVTLGFRFRNIPEKEFHLVYDSATTEIGSAADAILSEIESYIVERLKPSVSPVTEQTRLERKISELGFSEYQPFTVEEYVAQHGGSVALAHELLEIGLCQPLHNTI